MPREYRLEDPGEGIHEAEILDVEVAAGDEVKEGDILFSIETDKATVEVPSPFTGTIRELAISEGDSVRVGDVLLTYSEEGDEEEEEKEEERDKEENGEREPENEEPEPEKDEQKEGELEETEREPEAEKGQADAGEREDQEASVKRAPEEEEPEQEASEQEERDREEDRPERGETEGRPDPEADRERPVPAAPATRRLARELGVSLQQVKGSGPGGRVTPDDVHAASGKAEKPESDEPEPEPDRDERAAEAEEVAAARDDTATTREEEAPAREAAPELPDFSRWGEVERVALRSVRRTTARRMARAWEEIPHVTHFDEVDITDLDALRKEVSPEVEEKGGKLTMTAFAVKAAAAALREHPRFNASLDMRAEEVVLKRYCHIGVAVDTERGLLVPVIRDADRKSLVEVAIELTELAERTREGELGREEMEGGSFTLTNPGPIGGIGFTPIINHPEVAILGMGRASLQPRVRGGGGGKGDEDRDGVRGGGQGEDGGGDQGEDGGGDRGGDGRGNPDRDRNEARYRIEPRLVLPLCLGFDHRVNDGADAAHFMNSVIEVLGDPRTFILHV